MNENWIIVTIPIVKMSTTIIQLARNKQTNKNKYRQNQKWMNKWINRDFTCWMIFLLLWPAARSSKLTIFFMLFCMSRTSLNWTSDWSRARVISLRQSVRTFSSMTVALLICWRAREMLPPNCANTIFADCSTTTTTNYSDLLWRIGLWIWGCFLLPITVLGLGFMA